MTTFLRAALGSVALGLVLTGCTETSADEGKDPNPAADQTAIGGTDPGRSDGTGDAAATDTRGADKAKPEPAPAGPALPEEQPNAKVSRATLKAWSEILASAPDRAAKAEAAGQNGLCIALDDAWFKISGLGDDTVPDLLGLDEMPEGDQHPVCLLEDTLVVIDLDTSKPVRGKSLFAQIPGAN